MYSEIRDLINKYPNIEDIIKEVREELTKIIKKVLLMKELFIQQKKLLIKNK